MILQFILVNMRPPLGVFVSYSNFIKPQVTSVHHGIVVKVSLLCLHFCLKEESEQAEVKTATPSTVLSWSYPV